MDFNWNSIKEIDGQNFAADNLDRAKYAKYLTNLLKNKGGTNKGSLSNYVFNLDAEWGAGKTYFLKRWSHNLKQHHPVVYIDAWAIDYLESPLMTVLSEIIEQLKKQTYLSESDEAKERITSIFKAAAPRIGSALMKRWLGFDFDVFNSENQINADSKAKEIDFSGAGEKVLELFCKEVTDNKKNVEALKLAIKEWVQYVVESPVEKMSTITKSYPAFIFIDELDRCKPTYAVEMLEAIKHVFDIPGLVFVVATNTKQLSHTVQAVYGANFHAEEYLSRFFDNKYYMRTSLNAELIKNHCGCDVFNQEILIKWKIIAYPFVEFNLDAFLKLCVDIFEAVALTPRQAIKVFNRLELVFINLPENFSLNVHLIILLLAMNEKNQKLFTSFYKEGLGGSNIMAYLRDHPAISNDLFKVNVIISTNIISAARSQYEFLSNEPYSQENKLTDISTPWPINLPQFLKECLDFTRAPESLEKINDEIAIGGINSTYGELACRKFLYTFCKVESSSKFYMSLADMAINLD